MTRIILKALNPVFLALMVVLAIALQTSLFSSYPLMYLQPDLVLLAVMWCGLNRGFSEGGVLTLIFAEMVEAHSSAPSGLFLISYMSIYLLTRISKQYLVISNFAATILLTMAASVTGKLLNLLTLRLMGVHEGQWRHALALMLPGAVMAGITAIWVYRGLERFDWYTYKNPKADRRLEEDLPLESEGGLG